MNNSRVSLTTFTILKASMTFAVIAGAAIAQAQTVAHNAEFHRFINSQRALEAETNTPTATAAMPGVSTLAGEPSPAGTFREAPAAFDNRTNGFDPQGAEFDTIDENNVVPLRSFNDNRFIF